MKIKAANALDPKEIGRFANLDLGLSNFFALAFSDATKHQILSGDRLAKKIQNFNLKIDKRKSVLVPDELKALQAKEGQCSIK